MINLKQDESVETLGNGVKVIISPSHGFGTDALLLADFAAPRKKDLCLDLGTGCGIIPLLWYRNGVQKDIYGVDIQEKAVDQFQRSLSLTKEKHTDTNRLHPVLADLKALPKEIPLGTFNVVTMNPPYKPQGTGILSETGADQIARHETECILTDICETASRLLNFGGKFSICLRPERLADTMEAFRKAGLEPKKLRFVQKRPETKPWLFLLEGRKGGKPFLEVQPPLYIQGPTGENSEELTKIIGPYANEEN